MADETDIRPELDPARWLDDHGDALFRYAMLRLRSRDLAEDMVQETLLAAFRSKDGYSGKSSERTWLVAILKHKIVDHFRKTRRETQIEDEEALDRAFDEAFDKLGHWKVKPARWISDPSSSVESGEFWDAFESCMDGLPERHSAAFTLREMDGLEADEIRKILDVSTSNLWVILHRARARLRECLEENWFRGERNRS